MAEDLTDYMKEVGIRVRYLHSDIDTLERAEIIRDMRLDVFDVLVGINLPERGTGYSGDHTGGDPGCGQGRVPAIVQTSLIQTIGRAARNAEGHVIMYADTITDSMREAHGRDQQTSRDSDEV